MTFDKTYPTKELRKCKNPLVLALAAHSFMYYVLYNLYVDSCVIKDLMLNAASMPGLWIDCVNKLLKLFTLYTIYKNYLRLWVAGKCCRYPYHDR